MTANECGRYRALLSAYAEDDLEGESRAGVERHLTQCVTCRREVDGWRETRPAFGRVAMPAGFWASREQALVAALSPPRPAWRRAIDLLARPLPVPRAVAFATVLLVVWLSARGPAGEPATRAIEAVTQPAIQAPAAPRPLMEMEGLSRPSADVASLAVWPEPSVIEQS